MTTQEIQTVNTLISLGDSKELAIKTVIANRPQAKMKAEQLKDQERMER